MDERLGLAPLRILAAVTLAMGVGASSVGAAERHPGILERALEARLLERGLVQGVGMTRSVAIGATALYAINLSIVTAAQPSLPLREKAAAAGELMRSPEVAAGLGGFVVGDVGTEALLRRTGVRIPRAISLAITPAVGEVVAEVALEVLDGLRLERRVQELSLEELRRFAGDDLGKYQRLRDAHARYLVPGGAEALARELTGGSIEYGRGLATGGGWAVGALAGGAVGGPLGGLGGGLHGAVAVSQTYDQFRELFQDEYELLAEAEELAEGGAFDPEDSRACRPGADADPEGCAAWVRARRAARRNLLGWGAEGLARVAAEYQLALKRSRTPARAATWEDELEAVVEWNRHPAHTRGEPPPRSGPFHGLRLGLARTSWALRLLDLHWAREHHEAGPGALREAGFEDELRLVVAASRRADRTLIHELRERFEAVLLALASVEIEAYEFPQIAATTRTSADLGAGGLWGFP